MLYKRIFKLLYKLHVKAWNPSSCEGRKISGFRLVWAAGEVQDQLEWHSAALL